MKIFNTVCLKIRKNFSSTAGLSKRFLESSKRMFCIKTEYGQKQNEELNEINNIKEFREGIMHLEEGKFSVAETNFKECLSFLKHSNSVETLGYNYILRKLIQTLLKSRKYEESEKLLNASLSLSEKLTDHPELVFTAHRNILAFYTYTNIEKATQYVEFLLNNTDKYPKSSKKYFTFAAGPIYLLNNEYVKARKYVDQAISSNDLGNHFVGFALHNLALLVNEKQRHYDVLPAEAKEKWVSLNDFKENQNLDKEFLIINKQALFNFEIKGKEKTEEEGMKKLKEFLSSDEIVPKNLTENVENDMIKEIKSGHSGLTISNLAEFYFEKDMRNETAFWLKLGLKYYDKHEQSNIARHLILFALFYSQLGQTLMAEGLYRKGLALLENHYDYNVVFGMNMYGRLLLRQEKRVKEANELLDKSEKIASSLPFWYNRLVKVRFLDYDFE